MNKYILIGSRLGAYIRSNNPSTPQVQALLADLLYDDDLLSPMREVVLRPSFSALIEAGGSGRGTVQRQALLQEISHLYLPKIVNEIGQLINGLLDLSESNTNTEYTKDDQITRGQANKDATTPSKPRGKVIDEWPSTNIPGEVHNRRIETRKPLDIPSKTNSHQTPRNRTGNNQTAILLLIGAASAFTFIGLQQNPKIVQPAQIPNSTQATSNYPTKEANAQEVQPREEPKEDCGAIVSNLSALEIGSSAFELFISADGARCSKQIASHLDERSFNLHRSSRWSEALSASNAAINLDQGNSSYYYLRGNIKTHLDDFNGACADFRRAEALGFTSALMADGSRKSIQESIRNAC
jgi:hypothetical protein